MNYIITIGREYGSGSREIGYQLAKLLDIPYYDKEMMAMVSRRAASQSRCSLSMTKKREPTLFPPHRSVRHRHQPHRGRATP